MHLPRALPWAEGVLTFQAVALLRVVWPFRPLVHRGEWEQINWDFSDFWLRLGIAQASLALHSART